MAMKMPDQTGGRQKLLSLCPPPGQSPSRLYDHDPDHSGIEDRVPGGVLVGNDTRENHNRH